MNYNIALERKKSKKKSNEKSVICREKPTVYALRQVGYQCISEHYYENLDVELFNCVGCRI